MKSWAIFLTFVAAVLIGLYSYACGYTAGEESVRLEAIEAGVAVEHPSGPREEMTFRWLPPRRTFTSEIELDGGTIYAEK